MNDWDSNLLDTSGGGETVDRYLIFKMGGDLYGVPLLEILEVIEPIAPQSIPNTQAHFMGLINVRGRIYFVVDFRIKFHLASSVQEGRPAYLLYQEGTSEANFSVLNGGRFLSDLSALAANFHLPEDREKSSCPTIKDFGNGMINSRDSTGKR